MKEKNKYIVLGIIVIMCCCFVWQTIQINRISREIIEKDKEIISLSEEIEELRYELIRIGLIDIIHYDSKKFNYLAIGNSITKHGKCDYWWNEIGMAASDVDKDYYHIVSSYLEEYSGKKVVSYAVNFSQWETNGHDRAQTFGDIKKYLSEELDLVTIQLSENVSDLTTFESDFEELVKYVHSECPNAQIILVDEFWDSTRSQIKKGVANKFEIPFADLSEIRGCSEYQSYMGAMVYDSDGGKHIVEHAGTAGHPGDSGMQYIADAIIALLK